MEPLQSIKGPGIEKKTRKQRRHVMPNPNHNSFSFMKRGREKNFSLFEKENLKLPSFQIQHTLSLYITCFLKQAPDCSRPTNCQNMCFYRGLGSVNQVHFINSAWLLFKLLIPMETVRVLVFPQTGSHSWHFCTTEYTEITSSQKLCSGFVNAAWNSNFVIRSRVKLVNAKCLQVGSALSKVIN